MSESRQEYDVIRKIILKNTQIKYHVPTEKGIIEISPTHLTPPMLRTINIDSDVVEQLETYFRRRFHEEEKNQTASGTMAHPSGNESKGKRQGL